MLKVKSGVTPRNLWIAAAAANVAQDMGITLTVTAGTDGKHMIGSKHYEGAALDIRTYDQLGRVPDIMQRLADRLGSNFQVIRESDHLHVEYDPQGSVRLENV